MIDWLFEPASNWLVILLFILILFFLSGKDRVDRDRFKFIASALARIPAADRLHDRLDDEI